MMNNRADELYLKAKSVRKRREYQFASDYVKVIEVLYEEKGLTFQAISDFFRKNGLDFRYHAVRSAYKRFQKNKAEANHLIKAAESLIR